MNQIERLDRESCYRAVKSRDRRFDGTFYTAVKTTGIYCRPSCPARTPGLQNVSFFPTAAADEVEPFELWRGERSAFLAVSMRHLW